ncbi:single-strand selective monofunctional uracil DNA glycosylase-like [Rhagoletis pomonella]|uniref:single-strand selective monofunctional uracil DNA glycosylase-like n=1 Tax=Rhagoletis pomonella TaxID=28610 RepID=UPI001783CC7F|nr:single-strand selective monofunctional uracil DNA glycosylase-like [Rhagoletis pomonella]
MSRRKLAQDNIPAPTSFSGDSKLTVNALQQFAARKKRCLASQPTEECAKVFTVPPETTLHSKSSETKQSIWSRFYTLECKLNNDLQNILKPPGITHVYNPVEYASSIHCAYLEKYLDGPKRVVFVGMNPGSNGMGQTGVPFGNILTVRDEMGLTGSVQQPPSIHAKRPVSGLECNIEEPSGVRIWSLFKKLAGGSLNNFGRQCFVHNFCPLIFYDSAGHNITPSELKGDYKAKIGKACLDVLDLELDLLKTEILVVIGSYMHDMVKRSRHASSLKICKLPHPSPRSLNNHNWPEKAEKLLYEFDLIKYIGDEV